MSASTDAAVQGRYAANRTALLQILLLLPHFSLGIVPSGIIAIFVLQAFRAYDVLLFGQIVIAFSAMLAVWFASRFMMPNEFHLLEICLSHNYEFPVASGS